MNDSRYLHIYTTKGRCISSVRLVERTIDSSVEVTLPSIIQFQLISAGYCLKQWNEEEKAGIATSNGVEYILRVKSDSVARDMLPAGAVQMLSAIRAGRMVEPLTGFLIP